MPYVLTCILRTDNFAPRRHSPPTCPEAECGGSMTCATYNVYVSTRHAAQLPPTWQSILGFVAAERGPTQPPQLPDRGERAGARAGSAVARAAGGITRTPLSCPVADKGGLRHWRDSLMLSADIRMSFTSKPQDLLRFHGLPSRRLRMRRTAGASPTNPPCAMARMSM